MHTQYDSNNSSAHTEHYSQALAHRQAVSTERNEPPIIYDSQVQNWQSSQPRTILSVRLPVQGAALRLKLSRKPLSKNAKNTCDPSLNSAFAQLINGV